MAFDSATNPDTTPEEKARLRFIEDSINLSKLPDFRRWVFYIMEDTEWCAAHACRENVDNINETFLEAGKRQIGVKLLVHLQQCAPAMALRMVTESMNLRIERAAMSPMREK